MFIREFHQLINSGLPITWTTLKIGWEFGLVSKPQLIASAMDQIGYCPEEQAERVCELAFADETDDWTIKRCLDELASKSLEEQIYAKRVWRWILLDALVTEYQDYLPSVSLEQRVDGVWHDDVWTGIWCNFGEIWEMFEALPNAVETFQTRFQACPGQDYAFFVNVVQQEREWLIEERQSLFPPFS